MSGVGQAGFGFGQTTTSFSFGSSPFGNSSLNKPFQAPSNVTSTTSSSLNFSFPGAAISTSTVAPSQSMFSAPGVTTTATQNLYRFPSFGGLSTAAATNFFSSPLTTTGALTSVTATPSTNTQLGFGQLPANNLSNFFKPPNATTTVPTFGGAPNIVFGVSQSFPTNLTTKPLGVSATSTTTAQTILSPQVTTSQSTTGTGLLGFQTSLASTTATAFGSFTPSLSKPDASSVAKTTSGAFSVSFGTTSPSFQPFSSNTVTTLGKASLIQTSTITCVTTTTVASTNAIATTSTIASSATTDSALTAAQTLTYSQLEELINKWTLELEEHERYFLDEADRINQWDQALISNAENITTIYEKVETCQAEQTRLEQELDFIEGQQRELESMLEPLEHAANELPPGQLHSDYEREAIFQLATNVDLELGQLLNDLREIAEQVNATNSQLYGLSSHTVDLVNKDGKQQSTGDNFSKNLNVDGVDVMQQVTCILNCHMHSLNWIHHNTQEIMDRLKLLNTCKPIGIVKQQL